MSTIIDILAPGPSLKAYDRTRKPDITVCINRAIMQFPCDYWAVQDSPMWKATKERPLKGMITSTGFISKIGRSKMEIIFLKPSSQRGVNWTAPRTVATVCAKWPDAEIHLWGFDMVGVTYFDETPWLPNPNPNSRRSREQLAGKAEVRWQQEAAMLHPFLELSSVTHHKVH